MRAESLASTEADSFQTLLELLEETQRNFNELSAQLCETRSTQQGSRHTKKAKHMNPLERTQSTRLGLLQHGKRVRKVVV